MKKIMTLNRFASTALLLIGGVFLAYSGFVIDQLEYAPIAERPGEVSVGMAPALFDTWGKYSFDVPDSVTNPDDGMKYVVTTVRTRAFVGDCEDLPPSIDLDPDWNYKYRRIVRVTLPATINRIDDYPFDEGLDTLEINNSSKFIKLGNRAFSNCHLKEFNFKLLPSNPDSIGEEIFEYNKLEQVDWPAHLREIPYGTFKSNNVKRLKLRSTVKKIGWYAFSHCELDTLTIPNGVEIGTGAFQCNLSLKELNLGENCKLGCEAFMQCDSLRRVILPRGTRFRPYYKDPIFVIVYPGQFKRLDIDRDVIFDVPNIRLVRIVYPWMGEGFEVYYHTSTPQETESAELFSDDIYKDGTLYVEGEEGVENARNTFPWSKFVNILPIEGTTDPSGVAEPGLSDNESVSEVYSLDGIRISKEISELGPGCYIVRKGSKVRKIVVN
ncbi:MAG: leucine-rich repeat domain-containing protein [Muribaculaceae bacterium]|nr:leucine-rich repeat domain-containing protein [Muribaculaceae bacterium]